SGHRVALRFADGEVALHDLGELLARKKRPVLEVVQVVDSVESVEVIEAIEDEHPTEAAPPAPAPAREPVAVPPLAALEPRVPVAIAGEVARDQLADELRSVALWTLGAIAEAWDTRRLGYGNEGRHPFEHEVGAILGMNTGYAGDYVAAARET